MFDKKEYHQKYRQQNKEELKKYHSKWRAKNRDKIRERYHKVKEIELEYKRNNREKTNKQLREWRKKNPSKVKDYTKKYKEKIKVQMMANKHIRIPNGQMCQECGKRLAIHKHHEDYNKPLEVEFLCGVCHSGRRFKNGKSS